MSKFFSIFLLSPSLTVLVCAVDSFDSYALLTEPRGFCQSISTDASSTMLATGSYDDNVYIYSISNSGVRISQILTGFNGDVNSLGFSIDGVTLFATELNGGIKVFKKSRGGQFISYQNISGFASQGGCMTNDARFLARSEGTTLRIYKANLFSQYDSLQNISIPQSSFGCRFSDNNIFLFVTLNTSEIFKYDGSFYKSHQIITLKNATAISIMDYKSPYFLFPQYNATSSLTINYYSHNQISDKWEIVFQYPGNKSGSIFGIATSHDHKYVSVTGATSTVNKGNIFVGYTRINSYSQASFKGEFTPNNKFFFVTNFNSSTSVYINCNWNTSGNYFYNSDSGLCEECVGCLDCSSGGICISCDEANNYFLDAGNCVLCPIKNCLACSSLTTCLACDKNNNYFDDGQGGCTLCSIPNCLACSSLTTCSACNQNKNYFEDGQGGCTLCPLKNCLVCSSLTTCSDCDQNNSYFDDGQGGCALCIITNCLTCSSMSICSVCD